MSTLRHKDMLCCSGYMIAEHPYADDDDAYIIGYDCCHVWGCRTITSLQVPDRVKRTLKRRPCGRLCYRTGHRMYRLIN